jgi:hypothetical protein
MRLWSMFSIPGSETSYSTTSDVELLMDGMASANCWTQERGR